MPPGAKKPEKAKPSQMARDLAIYSMLIVILPSTVLAGYWIGAAADHYFGTRSVLAMLGLLAGAVIGFIQMYRIIIKGAARRRPGSGGGQKG